LHFTPGRPTKSKFLTEVLPRWKNFCESSSIPCSTTKIENIPDYFKYEIEEIQIAQRQKQKELDAQLAKKTGSKLGLNQQVTRINLFEERKSWRNSLHNVIQIRDAHVDIFSDQKKQPEVIARDLRRIEDRYEPPSDSIPLHIIAGGPSQDKVYIAEQLMRTTAEEERFKDWDWVLINPDGLAVCYSSFSLTL
jgi:hypothetical protein